MKESKDPVPVKPAFAGVLGIYRKLKKHLFSGVRLRYERFKQFLMLPACYARLRSRKDMRSPGWRTAGDLLVLFFSYKTFPDHYERYRLWEVDREDWKYYYGSNYHPHQQVRLRKAVQPPAYRVLFNDKYLCDLLCKALGIRTPPIYGVIDPIGDYRALIETWLRSSAAGAVIIKPLFGETGRNIVLAESTDRRIRIRSGTGLCELEDFVLPEKAVVQEFVRQDGRMAEFSRRLGQYAPHRDHADEARRRPDRQRGPARGHRRRPHRQLERGRHRCRHRSPHGQAGKIRLRQAGPRVSGTSDDGIVFEDRPVPEWDRLAAFAADVQRAFPFYRLLGLDLALDQAGEPVLIEINGSADLTFNEQVAGPLLKSVDVLRAFGDEDLLVNRHQRRLYADLAGPGGSLIGAVGPAASHRSERGRSTGRAIRR